MFRLLIMKVGSRCPVLTRFGLGLVGQNGRGIGKKDAGEIALPRMPVVLQATFC
jgi:hypothetical protein